jgi:hypothetical protein
LSEGGNHVWAQSGKNITDMHHQGGRYRESNNGRKIIRPGTL